MLEEQYINRINDDDEDTDARPYLQPEDWSESESDDDSENEQDFEEEINIIETFRKKRNERIKLMDENPVSITNNFSREDSQTFIYKLNYFQQIEEAFSNLSSQEKEIILREILIEYNPNFLQEEQLRIQEEEQLRIREINRENALEYDDDDDDDEN